MTELDLLLTELEDLRANLVYERMRAERAEGAAKLARLEVLELQSTITAGGASPTRVLRRRVARFGPARLMARRLRRLLAAGGSSR